MVYREPLFFHVMIKQGFTWFILASNNSLETVYINPDILPEMAYDLVLQCNFLYGLFHCDLPEDTIDVEINVHTLRGNITLEKTMPHNCPCVVHGEHKLNPFHHWLKI